MTTPGHHYVGGSLPLALRDDNPLNLIRMINGVLAHEATCAVQFLEATS
jgi:hypothetical protein